MIVVGLLASIALLPVLNGILVWHDKGHVISLLNRLCYPAISLIRRT
jgi:hypothetical protein